MYEPHLDWFVSIEDHLHYVQVTRNKHMEFNKRKFRTRSKCCMGNFDAIGFKAVVPIRIITYGAGLSIKH